MRKLLFLLVILAGFTSCSKDEEYEITFQTTLKFAQFPELYSDMFGNAPGGSPCPINGAKGMFYRIAGASEYYALIEDSGDRTFCPVLYKDFPDVDVFRFNPDILVVVDSKRVIRFYWTKENNPEPKDMIFETLLEL